MNTTLMLNVLSDEAQEKDEARFGRFEVGCVCPYCDQGILDYDGTLMLVCPACGKAESGSFT